MSSDQTVLAIAEQLFKTKPVEISSDPHAKEHDKLNWQGLRHCYSIVLLQEQQRYNKLIRIIDGTLELLIKAVQGLVLMSPELDEMYNSLLINKVPKNWESVSYSSLRPLASWFKDLHLRVEFMQKWMQKGHPKAFWLSGFFFPHGFMTGILQAYARKHQKAVDYLKFKFNFIDLHKDQKEQKHVAELGADDIEMITAAPADGVYIYGVFIESARWSRSGKCLRE